MCYGAYIKWKIFKAPKIDFSFCIFIILSKPSPSIVIFFICLLLLRINFFFFHNSWSLHWKLCACLTGCCSIFLVIRKSVRQLVQKIGRNFHWIILIYDFFWRNTSITEKLSLNFSLALTIESKLSIYL